MLQIVKAAESAGEFHAAVKALSEVAKLRERISERQAAIRAAHELDEVEQLRTLARAAAMAGSFVAASQLDRRAAELAERREAERREAEQRKGDAMSEGQAFEDLVLQLRALPPKLRARLVGALGGGS